MVMISTKSHPMPHGQAEQLSNELHLQIDCLRAILDMGVSDQENKSLGLKTLEKIAVSHEVLLDNYKKQQHH